MEVDLGPHGIGANHISVEEWVAEVGLQAVAADQRRVRELLGVGSEFFVDLITDVVGTPFLVEDDEERHAVRNFPRDQAHEALKRGHLLLPQPGPDPLDGVIDLSINR